ncbi:gustatory and odorant receptor 63a [Tribolium castaneum]|uniref:Gustatory receptor n=1 Tax=Tribolium castaneum TaxID=7070 RepID=D1ZZE0_TRICA|nr:PREDICTED: gustatory and odorant receptor 63a-like [Tribolium castaneum]EFA02933.1 gustatory receptor 99 [Tribolium castaneum]|eukprot:XP_015834785.1 PREDICTED: gustatory and odorant receptor 63a-like [Tribolium castaneum]
MSSKKDIRFMKIPYTIGSYLAVTPDYNFEKKVINRPRVHQIYALLLACAISVLSGITFIDNSSLHIKEQEPTFFILDLINFFFLFLHPIVMIISSSLLSGSFWSKMNKNFQFIDEHFNNVHKKESNFLRNCYVQFVLSLCGYLLNNLFVTISCLKLLPDIVLSKMHILSQVCYTYEFFTCFLICNLTTAFKCRFDEISRELQNHLKPSTTFIRQSGHFWRILSESVVCFNKIFGWPLIFFIGRGVVQLLQSLQLTMLALNSDFTLKKGPFADLVATNLFIVAYMTVCLVFVILTCDSAASSGNKISNLCYKLQKDFADSSSERRELILLAKEISDNPIKFTASDFFEINKSTFFGIISVTTTYLIILIQFKNS